MFTSLTFTGVKGINQQIPLDRVTVICGPNESGKSAAANALQLAVTGACEIGAQVSSQQKLMSGSSAMAVASGRGIEADWSIRAGKKLWKDPETQGGLPVTVDQFWELTGAERLKLIAPEGALTSIESRLAALELERKGLKTKLDAPAPPEPDAYEGPSIESVQQELREINAKIASHESAKRSLQQIEVYKQSQESNQSQLAAAKQSAEDSRKELDMLLAKEKAISAQLAIYTELACNEPRIIRSCRERGVTLRQAVSDTLDLVSQAIKHFYLENAISESMDVEKSICDLLMYVPDSMIPEIKEYIWEEDGLPISTAMTNTRTKIHGVNVSIERAEREIARLELQLAKDAPGFGGVLLGMEELFQLQTRLQELKKLEASASAWTAYEASLAKLSKSRVEASDRLGQVDGDIAVAKKEMTDKVHSLKGPIEDLANEYLKAAGQERLDVSINQTSRGWSLDITIGDVALEAMARSKRLLYGICLLSAIHETSSARCPVLIAECAEMDQSTLDRAVRAMKLRKKGNVLLEHWHKCTEDVNLVTLNFGKEV